MDLKRSVDEIRDTNLLVAMFNNGGDPEDWLDDFASRLAEAHDWSTSSLAYVTRPAKPDDQRPVVFRTDHEMWVVEFSLGLDHVFESEENWRRDVEAFLQLFHTDEETKGLLFPLIAVSSVTGRVTAIGANVYCKGLERTDYIDKLYRIAKGLPPLTVEEQTQLRKERIAEARQKAVQQRRERDQLRVDRGLAAEVGSGEPEKETKFFAELFDPYDALDDIDDLAQEEIQKVVDRKRRDHERSRYDGLELGASRIGGLPDLPPGEEWPAFEGKTLPFIGQLDLEMLDGAYEPLPPKGFLLFFALISDEPIGRTTPCRVVYSDCTREALRRMDRPPYESRWADWEGVYDYDLTLFTNQSSPTEWKRKKRSEEEVARLFGMPEVHDDLPGTVADHAILDGQDWITLFTVYSVNNMQWSDSGELHFFARRRDLQAGDLDSVLVAVDSG